MIPDIGSAVVLLANASGYEQITQVDQIAVGVVGMLNGKSPALVSSLPFFRRFLYWAIPVTLLLQVFGTVLVWRRRQRIRGWAALVTVILYLAVVALLLGLSQLIPFRLPSMLLFYPEVGYGLIVVATLGIGWSVIFLTMSLMMRRSR